MSLLVKICGLSTPETVDAALDAGADMVGFVFFPPSPRFVAPAAAAPLAARARGRAAVTVLTVDMDAAGIAEIVAAVRPDWLQLHGHEPPAEVAALKARFGLPVMKAVGIREPAALGAIAPYAGIADRILLDAKPPKGATRPGGNAVTFDWAILDGFVPGLPWMLSGGPAPRHRRLLGRRVGAGGEGPGAHRRLRRGGQGSGANPVGPVGLRRGFVPNRRP